MPDFHALKAWEPPEIGHWTQLVHTITWLVDRGLQPAGDGLDRLGSQAGCQIPRKSSSLPWNSGWSCAHPVKEPERNENTLDLFAANNDTLIMRCDVMPGSSDHSAILVDNRLGPFHRKGTRRAEPLWKKAGWNGTKSHIDLAWNQLFDSDKLVKAADDLWTWFTTTLKEAIKKFEPHRMTKRRERNPWISRSSNGS